MKNNKAVPEIPKYYPVITEQAVQCQITRYKQGRFYEGVDAEGVAHKPKPSVTNVLKTHGGEDKEGLMRWASGQPSWEACQEALHKAGDIGHFCHSIIMHLFKGRVVNLDADLVAIDDECNWIPDPETDEYNYNLTRSNEMRKSITGKSVRKRMIEFMAWWQWLESEYDRVEVLASELMLYHPGIHYAGTVDLVLRVTKGEEVRVWMVDFKTGSSLWLKDELQQIAYIRLWNELYGDLYGPIHDAFLLHLKDGWRRTPTPDSMKKRFASGRIKDAYYERFDDQLKIYYREYVKCVPGELTPTTYVDFQSTFSLEVPGEEETVKKNTKEEK